MTLKRIGYFGVGGSSVSIFPLRPPSPHHQHAVDHGYLVAEGMPDGDPPVPRPPTAHAPPRCPPPRPVYVIEAVSTIPRPLADVRPVVQAAVRKEVADAIIKAVVAVKSAEITADKVVVRFGEAVDGFPLPAGHTHENVHFKDK